MYSYCGILDITWFYYDVWGALEVVVDMEEFPPDSLVGVMGQC